MRRSSMHWPILRCDSASSISDRIHQRARSKPRKRCAPSTRPKFRNGGRSSRRPTSGRNEPAEIVERFNRDNPDTDRELNFGRLVNPAKDTTHVIAEMGTHHAGGVAGCGALWLYWSRRRERGCCPHPILYLPRHISRPARPRPSGGESRARTLTQRALPGPATPRGGKTRTPPECGSRKESCSSGVSGILRGAGGTRTPSDETPDARQIFRIRGPLCLVYFRHKLVRPIDHDFGSELLAFTAACAEFLGRPHRVYPDRARPPWQVR